MRWCRINVFLLLLLFACSHHMSGCYRWRLGHCRSPPISSIILSILAMLWSGKSQPFLEFLLYPISPLGVFFCMCLDGRGFNSIDLAIIGKTIFFILIFSSQQVFCTVLTTLPYSKSSFPCWRWSNPFYSFELSG